MEDLQDPCLALGSPEETESHALLSIDPIDGHESGGKEQLRNLCL